MTNGTYHILEIVAGIGVIVLVGGGVLYFMGNSYGMQFVIGGLLMTMLGMLAPKQKK